MNMTRCALVAALLASGLALPRAASAQEQVSAADPETLAAVIRDLGFQARLDTDNTGDPVIRSSANGGDFQIEFYGCTGNRECKTLRFYAGYDLRDGTSLDVVNQWNTDKRFASAYLDEEDDPFLQMDINTEGGISRVSLETSFEIWQSLKGQFESHIGWRR